MAYDIEVEKVREELIRAYAEGLNDLSIEPLMDIFHPEFQVNYLRTDLRYIGHLAKVIVCLKRERKTLQATFEWMQKGTYRFPIVRLHAPIDDRLFYRNETDYYANKNLPPIEADHDVILYCRIKDSKIFRVFYGDTDDTIMQIHKPAQCIGEDKYEVEKSMKVPPVKFDEGDFIVFEYLPIEQRIEWRKMMIWNIVPHRIGEKITISYEEYEAFYEAWVNGTPCEREWFRYPNR